MHLYAILTFLKMLIFPVLPLYNQNLVDSSNFNKFFLVYSLLSVMASTKVVIFGLSTEGYTIASQMAMKGATVYIVDESTPSAIMLSAEVAKTYPNVSALKEDEPLLAVEPIDVAISKAKYLFFTPRIRKIGQDLKTEILQKFKDAITSMKKNSSVIFCLPTGLDGNNDYISYMEHVTGFRVGKHISYFYYPLEEPYDPPKTIGSFRTKTDDVLADLLSVGTTKKKFVALASSEYFHIITVLSRFSAISSVLEVCKYAKKEIPKQDLTTTGFQNIFIDEMLGGLFDLRSLGTSFEGPNTLMYLINTSTKGIDTYVKRLVDTTRLTLKNNNLKASKTKVAISWTLDPYSIRGDKLVMLETLKTKLCDYIGDVEAYADQSSHMFFDDKITIVIVCSKFDADLVEKSSSDSNLIIIKANPLCEVLNININ